jgi:cytochrome c oxidase subunit 3
MADVQARASQKLSGPASSKSLALRTHPLVLGVVLFLAQDTMIFGGLIAAYFNLRGITAVWPPANVHIDETEGIVGTAMLAISSVTMLFATHYLAKSRHSIARLWLGASILLGTAFVFLTIRGWSQNAYTIGSNAYGSVYYVMTGFHVAHVTAGVLLMLILFGNMHKAAFQRDQRAGAEAIGFFWHFVFIIWLLVWATIFVVK